MDRFGKSHKDIIQFKGAYFSDQEKLLQSSEKKNALYRSQPLRHHCKICQTDLGEAWFEKNGIQYIFCANCNHLNGGNQDTNEFTSRIYSQEGGKEYSAAYKDGSTENYLSRVEKVYRPKVDFLLESLNELGIDGKTLRVVDLGAGSGYFIRALRQAGFANSTGYEVSESQAALANMMSEGEIVHHMESSDLTPLVSGIDADLISMIGVLEHLSNPMEVLAAINENPKIRYIYLSVPLFSLTVFFEIAFPGQVHRHLSGTHTHLFTDKSLRWLENRFALIRQSTWWFGADFMDLYRNISQVLKQNISLGLATDQINREWEKMFGSLIDELQLIADQRQMSSEVHLLYEKANSCDVDRA